MSLRLPVGERDHIHGPNGARVTLVEYGDYECPHCGAAFPVLKRVEQLLGDELRFVFRNFPLSEMHPHALQAAEAAEAAAAQGKFWNMHDLIFDNQRALGRAHLSDYAGRLGLDLPRFERDLDTHTYLKHIEEDFNSGVRSGVNGTPTLFINGARYEDEVTVPLLVAALKGAPVR